MIKITNHPVRNFYIISLIFLFSFPSYSQTGLLLISGRVVDKESEDPLVGVNVSIKHTISGTVSDLNGRFSLKTRQQFPFSLIITYVGYKPQEIVVRSADSEFNIKLVTETVLANEVVVTASRVEESILKSPVAIEKLDIRALKETPAPSFYDALENVKGVQMTTSSLTFKVPNTRGFNMPNNFRFVQLVDGVDMQAATLGVPLGNAIGPTELDIASIEITPGAASALYGMNAINGMANLLTKSPFYFQGLSVYHKTGVNHIDGIDRDPGILTESALRYAKALNNKLAFKINISYMRGTDWLSNTSTDQNPNHLNTANPDFQQLSDKNNPASDAWNKYGDENNNAVTLSGVQYQGKNQTFLLRRTGYWERDLVNPVVENFKVDGALHYRITDNAELSYSYRLGEMDGVFQRGNKIQLNNVRVQNHRLELKGSNFIIRSYVSMEDTGDSYNLKPLADNLQLTHLSNSEWRDRFQTSLQSQLDAGTALAEAMQLARKIADQGRAEPGTLEFRALKSTINSINNWDHVNTGIEGAPETGGAWLHQMSRMYHADGQYDFSGKLKFADILFGADARIYEVIPDGNNFVDFSRPLEERTLPGGDNVYYNKYGAFAQATKLLLNEKLKLSTSLRVDYNPEFDPTFNPRIAGVYTIGEKHNLRVSWQNGFRYPALFEALSYVNNGNVRRVGGLSYINKGLGYLDNSYTLVSVNDFNAFVNRDITDGLTLNEAVGRNREFLTVTNLSPTKPEHINSFEIGYKSSLFDNTLIIDFDAYTNNYKRFLGQVEVSVPFSGLIGSNEAVMDMIAANRTKQTRYRVFTNAKKIYTNYGSALGLTYLLNRKYTVSGNINYNNISENKEKDVFVTAFNTPKWISNLSFGNREVTKNIGFNIVWKWQNSFLWQSPLANGIVPAYHTLDAQISFKVPSLNSSVKVGGANILNCRYIQYAAGPTIGALYYLSVTIDVVP